MLVNFLYGVTPVRIAQEVHGVHNSGMRFRGDGTFEQFFCQEWQEVPEVCRWSCQTVSIKWCARMGDVVGLVRAGLGVRGPVQMRLSIIQTYHRGLEIDIASLFLRHQQDHRAWQVFFSAEKNGTSRIGQSLALPHGLEPILSDKARPHYVRHGCSAGGGDTENGRAVNL